VSYEILSLNPPVVEPPGAVSDLKYSANKGNIVLPTDPLVKAYLQRRGKNASKEYYTRPEQRLGVGDVDPHLSSSSSSGYKGSMADAYHFAQRQYEFMQQHWKEIDEGALTEEECVKAVNDILQKEEQNERFHSRKVSTSLNENMKEMKSEGSKGREHESELPRDQTNDKEIAAKTTESSKANKMEGIPSILHGNTNAVLQMTQWGDRLSRVPYNRWTVGAATALDHWIATTILGLSEHAWQDALQKKEHSRSRVQDIITVRHALFPETMDGYASRKAGLNGEKENVEEVDLELQAQKETEKSIDELLASLGVDDENDDFWKKTDESADENVDEDDFEFGSKWDETEDQKLMRLKTELKNWQERNEEVPYGEWSEKEKKTFNVSVLNLIGGTWPAGIHTHCVDCLAYPRRAGS